MILGDYDGFSIVALVIMFVAGLIGQLMKGLKKKNNEEEAVEFDLDELIDLGERPIAPAPPQALPKIATPTPPVALKVSQKPQMKRPTPLRPKPQRTPRGKRSMPPMQTALGRTAIKDLTRSPTTMRQAILLAEILSPPLALREPPSSC